MPVWRRLSIPNRDEAAFSVESASLFRAPFPPLSEKETSTFNHGHTDVLKRREKVLNMFLKSYIGLCFTRACNEQRQSQQMQQQSDPTIRTLRSLLRLKYAWVPGLSFLGLSPKILSLRWNNENALACHFLFPSEPLSDKQSVGPLTGDLDPETELHSHFLDEETAVQTAWAICQETQLAESESETRDRL